jgi:hypothetical protein
MKAKTIIEIAGSPKEHVEKTLSLVLDEAKKAVKVTNAEVFPAEEKQGLWTTFAELDVFFPDVESIYTFCFRFLPSSIDIIEPESLSIDTKEFSNSLNDLLATLHSQDRALKENVARVKILNKNTNRLLANFISFIVQNPSSPEEIGKKTGIPKDELSNLLNIMVKEGKLLKTGELYKKI